MGTNPGYARDIAQGSDQALRDPVLRSSTYASTLSRSVSARASTTPSRQNLRPIFSRQAQHTPFQHQSEPQCEKPSVQRGSSPYADTRSSRADNLGSQQQRLASLFQQARSQTISRQSVSRSPSTSDHVERPRPPAQNKTTRSPANHRSQTRQTLPYARNECSEESNRHPPSLKPDSTVKVILPNPHTDYVQGSTIEERIRFIRAKAEETRLELLALEQLELDMCQQAGQEAGVIGQSVSTKDITLSISTLPIRHGTKSGSTTRSGTSRHSPRTPSPLSMSFAPDAVTRKGPTPDRSSSDSFNSIDQKNKPRHSGYIVEVDPLSSSPPDPDSSSPPVSPLEYEDLSTSCSSLESGNQNRKTLISTARRVPITQAQPNIALVAALRRPVDTVGRLHGWVPTPKRQAEVTSSNSADDDDDEEILDSYLSEYQEDLRDTTISDMMRQHLFLLSDSDENSEGKETHSAGSPFDSAKTVNTITGESLLPEADLTFADRTGYFMSMLEQDYDQQAGLSSGSSIESVPMLLSETLPEVQDDADSSFIGQSSAGTQSPQKTIMERNASSSSSPHLQRELLNSTSFSKGSILEEFLKSNPRISKLGSPLDRPEPLVLPPPTQQQQAHSRQRPVQTLPPPGPTFNPTPSRILNCTSSSTQSWANRVKPLPTPIITSHEYCRQVTQRRSGHCSESQRPALPHLSSQAVANEVNSTKRQLSPLISRPLTSPTSPWSGFQTPLISKAPDSSDVTAIESGGISDSASSESQPTTPLSVYNSAKEEFPVGSMLFHDDDLNIPGSQDSKKPTAPSHGLNITTAPAAPAAPTSASFDKVVPAQKEVPKSTAKSQNRQPLDMIIVRPSMIPEVCATPEDPVSSVGSGTSTSSWTWSWPSSATSACRLSTSSTTTASDGEEETLITHGQMNASGEPQRLHPQGIKIKSRSMSSLVKHQNGWLGFMALDVRLAASGRNHIVVATHSNQIYTCWEHHDNDMNNDGPGHDNKNPVDTTRGKGPKRKNGPEKLAIELILGRMTMTDNGAGFIQDTTLQPGLVQIDGKMFVLESKVTKIVCSDWATFLLTEHGNLWGWGYFEDKHGHRISLVNKSGSQVGPIKICPQRIIDVACGNNHVLILNASKDVISWGANDRGQLGRPKQQASQVSHVNSTSPPPSDRSLDIEDDMDQSPYFIEGLPPNIIGIGSGKNFSFAWDEERLYGWGDNSSGQLGRLLLPSLSSSPNIAASAASGMASSNLSSSTTSSSISSSSSPMERFKARYGGRYGLRETVIRRPHPIQLHWKGSSIKQVCGGRDHTVILTNSGLIITMGSDEYGQLGLAQRLVSGSDSKPKQPRGSGNEVDRRQFYKTALSRSASMSSHLSCRSGNSSSSSSTYDSALNSSPRSWWSRLTDSPSASAGSDSEALKSTCTGSASSVFSDTRHNDQSSLQSKVMGQESGSGNNIRLYPSLVKVGPGVQQISCGELHTVCFTDSGEMWTWGKGYDGLVVIQSRSGLIHWETFCHERPSNRRESNSNRMVGYRGGGHETYDVSARRRIVSVSTMSQGISIALVSND